MPLASKSGQSERVSQSCNRRTMPRPNQPAYHCREGGAAFHDETRCI
jgi:hypothetical protein